MNPYLAATLLALACGPALYAAARRRPRLRRGFDLLVWCAVLGLLLLDVVPDALRIGGAIGAICFLVGLFGPTALEHLLRGLRRQTHVAALLAALAGLALHALADGAVIAADAGGELGLAVALHTLPIGLAICWLAVPLFGWARSLLILGSVALATLLGYWVTPDLEDSLGPVAWSWLQMGIAGLLLHALYGRPHAEHPGAHAH